METPLLNRYLAEADAECPVCGYQLRGLTGDLCPECGVKLTLGVGTPDSRLVSWVTGIIMSSIGGGFSIVVGGWVLVTMLTQSMNMHLPGLWPVLTGCAVGAAQITALILGRRRFRKCGTAIRWSIVVGITVTALVSPVLFFIINS